MTYQGIITQVANELSLPPVLVDRAYRAYWKAVREHICSLPLKDDLSDEDFLKLQPNVNIPSMGKLHVTLERYRKVKQRYNQNIKGENATHNEN